MRISLRLRWFVLAVIALLAWLWPQWQWSGRDQGETSRGSGVVSENTLRIVCVGGEKFMRCPSDCVVDERGQADCRCQDFYYQRGDQPLTFSHSLCR